MQTLLVQPESRLALNPQYQSHSLYPSEADTVLNAEGFYRAKHSISQWPGYAPTPLFELSNLARELEIASLCYKDENSRFGLGSFKPLGGAYAVASLLQKQIGTHHGDRTPDISELIAGRHRHITGDITVTAATDGNMAALSPGEHSYSVVVVSFLFMKPSPRPANMRSLTMVLK